MQPRCLALLSTNGECEGKRVVNVRRKRLLRRRGKEQDATMQEQKHLEHLISRRRLSLYLRLLFLIQRLQLSDFSFPGQNVIVQVE